MTDNPSVKAATPHGLGVQASIICSNEKMAYLVAMDYLRPTGTAMIVGLPPTGSHVPADCRNTVLGMKAVKGVFVGTKLDALEALEVVAKGGIVPTVQVLPFKDLQATYDRMRDGTLCGRVVLDCECHERREQS